MSTNKNNVVIVDDETEILDILSEEFKAAGYKVWCAENISSGLALVRSITPAVVITDMHLPLGGGKDLFDEVLAFPREIRPIMIFITGNTLMPIDVAYDQGAEGYITKPFVRSEVIQYVGWLQQPIPSRWNSLSEFLGPLKKSVSHIELEFPDTKIARQSKGIGFGRGGLFIRMKDSFPDIGDIVDLKIQFGNSSKTIAGKAIVRWKRDTEGEAEVGSEIKPLPTGIGVEFLILDSKSIKFLLDCVGISSLTSYIPKD